MTANVRIVTDQRENVLKVPNAALRVRIAGVEPVAASASAPAGAGSGSRTGNSASGTGTTPQSSQWMKGIGQPQ